METLTPFLEHDLTGLPNETHGRAGSGPAPAYAARCLPCRQKNAACFLAGDTPGVMAFYAPGEEAQAAEKPAKRPRRKAPPTEDEETVQRLLEWREQAPYG